jgi:competence ComEA-like helix-hairpin-helix protein
MHNKRSMPNKPLSRRAQFAHRIRTMRRPALLLSMCLVLGTLDASRPFMATQGLDYTRLLRHFSAFAPDSAVAASAQPSSLSTSATTAEAGAFRGQSLLPSLTLSPQVKGGPPWSVTSPCVAAAEVGPAHSAVDLNRATETELDALPGIGPQKAKDIVALRNRLSGRFHSLEQLMRIRGFGPKQLQRLRPLIRLGEPQVLQVPKEKPP